MAHDIHRRPLPHIPSDLVVDHWTSAVESSSPLDFLTLHAMWTPFGRLIWYKIMSIISVGCDFTTKSEGIWVSARVPLYQHAAVTVLVPLHPLLDTLGLDLLLEATALTILH